MRLVVRYLGFLLLGACFIQFAIAEEESFPVTLSSRVCLPFDSCSAASKVCWIPNSDPSCVPGASACTFCTGQATEPRYCVKGPLVSNCIAFGNQNCGQGMSGTCTGAGPCTGTCGGGVVIPGMLCRITHC